ncbi:pyrimidine operon attenuation protein / uracil phosphoribosyltransferase [Atopomonas hussainii]|uniref:Pyrimidine operon attenuation protein / uracil phosphoribosyltransferase n=1 Tax=Atopomonas hussainii TaxID=1429083 RepID=A0A1H7I6I9_9GAMM|nr:bifunctional pyr operon transcriptional regulator/uracil phosphoribosyltransferase PyrR [Atopomonas hussainii]SEK58149.1 pyrimidine operon attenuation protein / uracil phosphoribosyltransferase [Atopomonas hussainii]
MSPSLPSPAELIPALAHELKALLAQKQINAPQFIGIRTGGVWVAQALLAELGHSDEHLGTLDVSFYRDDFTQNGLHPQVQPSALPFDIEGQHLVLVDDVLMSGRTIRAALNELFDYGRPASVTLVTLIELDARELPIRADVSALRLSLPADQRVKLRGPQPLSLELRQLSAATA